jgi:tyrosyl-tRNA synthetase
METGKLNPKDAKIILAKEIISLYHSKAEGEEAAKNFESVFKSGSLPSDAVLVKCQSSALLADVLLEAGVVSSKTEFRRLVGEGAISSLSGESITDPYFKVESGLSLRIGKKRFVKIEVSS